MQTSITHSKLVCHSSTVLVNTPSSYNNRNLATDSKTKSKMSSSTSSSAQPDTPCTTRMFFIISMTWGARIFTYPGILTSRSALLEYFPIRSHTVAFGKQLTSSLLAEHETDLRTSKFQKKNWNGVDVGELLGEDTNINSCLS